MVVATLRLGLVVLGLVVMIDPVLAQAQPAIFTDQQRQAIGEIARAYLLKNPEVLQEVIAKLEGRQQKAQKAAQTSTLQSEGNTLYRSPNDYVVGNLHGDVTLVEFLDYNCPYCKKALADVRVLMKADPKLRVVLKDFPVLGPESLEASRVALAAKLQLKGDRVLEYHTKLMEVRGRINGERAKAIAREMGLDMPRLEKDLESAGIRNVIQENLALADKLGINGTPVFIIGDEIVSGAVGSERLQKAISNVRTCGKATC